jgi:hypothetical protein
LPSWSEGALGLLSVDAGTVEFTTDAPVVVRLYNTNQNVGDCNYGGHCNSDRWNNIDDMMLWRRRDDLAWCNAWKCGPSGEAGYLGSYWVVWERYFPEGTHALDTTQAAYQFFTPANGTLPGSDQPAELESAAYKDETPRPEYLTPTVNVSAPGYAAGLTPYDFGGSVDFWTANLYLRYPLTRSSKNTPTERGWSSFGYIATDAVPLPSWSEGALGLLSVDAGTVEFTTDAPVVVRLYNTKQNVGDCNIDGGHCRDPADRWSNIDDMMLWRRRDDLAWCNAWKCGPRGEASKVGSYWVVWERYFPEGTHALDTTQAAYQFFTPANGTLPGSDQPAELESAAYKDETRPEYLTPTVNVSAPGYYAAGLTPYDFGCSVDFWTKNAPSPMTLRYPLTIGYGGTATERGWSSLGYITTDADPLPSWSEGALGLLSVDAGTVEFTTDAPVVVRLYNTKQNRGDCNQDGGHCQGDRWNNIDDMMLWRRRDDLAWCNAWKCGPRGEASLVGSYWVVWERYFPEGTHALDTTQAAYQFFTPANGTLPGSDQPAELESAAYKAYKDETPGPEYLTPMVNTTNGHTLSQWKNDTIIGSLPVSSGVHVLPSWSEGALGLLSVDAGTVEFTTDAPVVVRLYNTNQNRDDCNRDGGHCNSDRWNNIDDMMLWRRRDDLAWCNAWKCGPSGEAGYQYLGSYWVVWERYFPEGTHALDTTQALYQFFTPANGTLPGNDQPAELESAAVS